MAKFKNIHTQSGKIAFKDQRIEFSGILETKDKDLIKFLSDSPNWIEEKSEDILSDLEVLKIEAKSLGIEFKENISLKNLQEKIEKIKSEESKSDDSQDLENKEQDQDLYDL